MLHHMCTRLGNLNRMLQPVQIEKENSCVVRIFSVSGLRMPLWLCSRYQILLLIIRRQNSLSSSAVSRNPAGIEKYIKTDGFLIPLDFSTHHNNTSHLNFSRQNHFSAINLVLSDHPKLPSKWVSHRTPVLRPASPQCPAGQTSPLSLTTTRTICSQPVTLARMLDASVMLSSRRQSSVLKSVLSSASSCKRVLGNNFFSSQIFQFGGFKAYELSRNVGVGTTIDPDGNGTGGLMQCEGSPQFGGQHNLTQVRSKPLYSLHASMSHPSSKMSRLMYSMQAQITSMVMAGTNHFKANLESVGNGDTADNIYRALRIYNSGSCDASVSTHSKHRKW